MGIPFDDTACSGHGVCDGNNPNTQKCVCDSTEWIGDYCETAANYHMVPASGASGGGTKVAFVFFRWQAQYFLNLNAYGIRGKIRVIFTKPGAAQGDSAIAFAITQPWDINPPHPGAAMGWAASAPTMTRTYGDGYHIYDGKHTDLPNMPRNTMHNGVVCNLPTEGWCDTWVISLIMLHLLCLTLHSMRRRWKFLHLF